MIFKIIINRIVSFITINAFLWDHDGTLFDTQKYHAIVESILLAEYGVIISPEEITRLYAGVRTQDFFHILFKKHGIKANINEVMIRKWKMMIEIIEKNGLNYMPGAEWLVKNAKLNGIEQVIGSASNREFILFCLNKKNIVHYFRGIISGDDVKKGKPSIETWVRCKKIANIPYNECLVLEDGDSGLIAAEKLGIRRLRISPLNSFKEDRVDLNSADFHTDDFQKISFLKETFSESLSSG